MKVFYVEWGFGESEFSEVFQSLANALEFAGDKLGDMERVTGHWLHIYQYNGCSSSTVLKMCDNNGLKESKQ